MAPAASRAKARTCVERWVRREDLLESSSIGSSLPSVRGSKPVAGGVPRPIDIENVGTARAPGKSFLAGVVLVNEPSTWAPVGVAKLFAGRRSAANRRGRP